MRWLHLGGRAPLPRYFEIVERSDTKNGRGACRQPAAADRNRATVCDGPHGGPADVGARRIARRSGVRPAAVRLGSRHHRHDRAAVVVHSRRPGSGRRGLVDAAARELAEGTGLRVDPAQMVGPVWRRDAMIDFNGTVIASQEFFFVHRTRRFEPSADGRTRRLS